MLIRDCEADQTDNVLSPKVMAFKRPVLTAIAYAMKAEPTKQRFVDDWCRMLLLHGSLKMQPKPPPLVVAFQAASTKQMLVPDGPHGRGIFLPFMTSLGFNMAF